MPDWKTLKRRVYGEDGSLLNVYVLGTSRTDWDRWITFVNARYPLRWEAQGLNENAPAPAIDAAFINRRWDAASEQLTVLAAVCLGTVKLHCLFYSETEIEQDLDPREIRTPADHEQVLAYLVDLSILLGKEVILTDENSEQAVWFRVNGKRVTFIDR
ncbi:hypothetical protein LJY25_03595 [Hymenobacter sp. BT175]|uniref:hypothetical protein n=1 Tax=Hymenobacter translucens TaxID=2886507 RepID=UPI001D0DC0FD|nr:hypothetical protein [Hymenobacter translucens]MCC2545515.1 hypothetical protein [Hymenobacter translucens]